jgi:hypothetical protein
LANAAQEAKGPISLDDDKVDDDDVDDDDKAPSGKSKRKRGSDRVKTEPSAKRNKGSKGKREKGEPDKAKETPINKVTRKLPIRGDTKAAVTKDNDDGTTAGGPEGDSSDSTDEDSSSSSDDSELDHIPIHATGVQHSLHTIVKNTKMQACAPSLSLLMAWRACV